MGNLQILHIFIAALTFRIANSENAFQTALNFHFAQSLQYSHVFSEQSDVSVVILACGGVKKLELAMKSFFYFNTYIINKIYIAHCSTDKLDVTSAFPNGFDEFQHYFHVVQAKNGKSGLVDALQQIYKQISTKYVYQTDDQWVTVKGFGYIEQSINILKHAETQKIKVSQIVSTYPLWRSNARLSQMQWTNQKDAFHLIHPFNTQKYLSFTLSPSIFQIKVIFEVLLQKNLKQRCLQLNCPRQSYEFDKCCIWNLGQVIHSKQYRQAYLNDGSSKPNHKFLKD